MLPNGLELEIFDLSSPTAGDRWKVEFLARVEIPFEGADLKAYGVPQEEIEAFVRWFGPWIAYTYRGTRNFIDRNQVEEVLKGMIEEFKKNALSYISHHDFRKRFLLHQFEQYRKNAKIGDEYVRKQRETLRGR